MSRRLGDEARSRSRSRGAAIAAEEPLEFGLDVSDVEDEGPRFKFDDFEVLRTIGEGSFGVAFLARHRASGTAVVLKRLDKIRMTEEERAGAVKEVQVRRAATRSPPREPAQPAARGRLSRLV